MSKGRLISLTLRTLLVLGALLGALAVTGLAQPPRLFPTGLEAHR